MDEEPNVIDWSTAAQEKGVARSTLYRAADRGELTAVSIGSRKAILRDDAYEQWTPDDRRRPTDDGDD